MSNYKFCGQCDEYDKDETNSNGLYWCPLVHEWVDADGSEYSHTEDPACCCYKENKDEE